MNFVFGNKTKATLPEQWTWCWRQVLICNDFMICGRFILWVLRSKKCVGYFNIDNKATKLCMWQLKLFWRKIQVNHVPSGGTVNLKSQPHSFHPATVNRLLNGNCKQSKQAVHFFLRVYLISFYDSVNSIMLLFEYVGSLLSNTEQKVHSLPPLLQFAIEQSVDCCRIKRMRLAFEIDCASWWDIVNLTFASEELYLPHTELCSVVINIEVSKAFFTPQNLQYKPTTNHEIITCISTQHLLSTQCPLFW